MPGDSTKITCGTIGKPCDTLEDYPKCNPNNEEDGWVGLEEIVYCEYKDGTKDFRIFLPGADDDTKAKECDKEFRPPQWEDLPETKFVNEAEIPSLLDKENNFLSDAGFKGICRAPYLGKGKPTAWYGYFDRTGKAGYLTLYNKGNPTHYYDHKGIWLSYDEMMGLAGSEALMLQKPDVICSKVPELVREEDDDGNISRTYKPGRYHFKKDKLLLEGMMKVLKDDNVKIEGFEENRREWLVNRLEDIQGELTKDDDRMLLIIISSVIGAVSGLMVSIYFGEMLYQKAKAKFFGRIKAKSVDERLKDKLKESPDYDILGRDKEANDIWMSARKKKGFKNVLINAPTGVGKDVAVEKALLMKVKNDPAVPKEWRDATVLEIKAGEVMKEAELRGKVGQAAIEIVETLPKRHKGKVIIWIKEADVMLMFGATAKDSTETPGKLFLSYLEEKYQMENVLFVLTTSRGKEMLSAYPDLGRRTNTVFIDEFKSEQIIEIAKGPVRAEYEKLYGIEVSDKALEQAMRLAEGEYRPKVVDNNGEPLGRFPAFDSVLERAFLIADQEGATEINLDILARATGALCNTTVDPETAPIKEILEMPLDQLEKRAAEQMKAKKMDSQMDPFIAQMESARLAMDAKSEASEMRGAIDKAMNEHPVYSGLQGWEKGEHARVMESMMAELKAHQVLHRFYYEGRFLEGKFDALAEMSKKGGPLTIADFTKAAEKVEKANPKAREEAKRAAKEFAKEVGAKK